MRYQQEGCPGCARGIGKQRVCSVHPFYVRLSFQPVPVTVTVITPALICLFSVCFWLSTTLHPIIIFYSHQDAGDNTDSDEAIEKVGDLSLEFLEAHYSPKESQESDSDTGEYFLTYGCVYR